MSARPDDAVLEELLGAYALDACEPDEVEAIEAMLARRPDLAREVAGLASAAVWVGATEALEAPVGLRDSLLARARARRGDDLVDASLRAYRASTARLEDAFDALDESDHDEVTANGLSARDLVVHLAAQESLMAQAIGADTLPEIRVGNVEARTAALIEQLGEDPLAAARDLWRRSVDAVDAWAADPSSRAVELRWLSFELPRDDILVARAFENWTHRDDLRTAMGHVTDPPPAAELHAMANLSLGAMPMALEATGHARPGKVARFVLTGAGGGEWTVPMGTDATATDAPDVTVTVDIVDWCRLAAERLTPDALELDVSGDESLVADLVAAAPAFATL